MKKLLSLVIALAMVIGLVAPIYSENEEAMPYEGFKLADSELKFNIDNEETELKFYLVSFWDSEAEEAHEVKANYVKLRDLAEVLKDSDSKFSIAYNAETRTIEIKTGEAYESNGSELKAFDMDDAKIVESNQKIMVDGEEVELSGFNINGENYYLTSKLSSAIKTFRYHGDLDPELSTLVHISTDKSDITSFDKTEFETILSQADYTIVYNWGPWCYWSKRSIPFMEQMDADLKEAGKNFQIVGVVNGYRNYTTKEISTLFKDGTSPWTQIAGDEAAYEYLNAAYGDKINFFPTRFVLNKEGKMVGKEFFVYQDEVFNKWLAENEKDENYEFTEEEEKALELEAYKTFLEKATTETPEEQENKKAE